MYCTVDDVLKQIPADTLRVLTNDDPTEPDYRVDLVDDAIADASEKIDAALRGRYTLPLKQPSTFLKSIAVDLVRHQLYMRRPDGGELPDGVVRAFKTANDYLKAISKGDLTLGIKDSDKSQPENGPWRVKAPKRQFDRHHRRNPFGGFF
ncbi:gp436 family protein [Acinetobacter puyangensis]|uniref:gp436 family protein n=1 Tax=Acinetobacter puyangensis TaxID=1096779 RepID=UPI003A4D911F